jgi:putative membrane protein
MHFIISLVVNAIIVLIAAYILPKVEIRNFGAAIVVALLIGILNPTIGWILRGALNIATLGIPALLGLGFIIRLVVTAIVLKIVDALVPGFKIHGFTNAIILAVIIALVSTLVDRFLMPNDADADNVSMMISSVKYMLA